MSVILKKYKGESATFGFILPESYDLSNLENVRVFVGSQIYPHTVENERLFKVALKSEDTIFMAGRLSVIFDIDDSVFGIKKVLVGEFQVENTTDTFSDASANTGIDVTFALSISETSITIDSVLYDVIKGDSAFQVFQSQPGNANKTYEQYIAYLREPMTLAIEDGNETAAEWAISEAERVANEIVREDNEEDRNAAEIIREQVKDATIIAKNEAIQATSDANDAATNANTKAGLANDTAILANSKAGLADTAATNANSKASLADAATTNANNAADLANSKAGIAQTAADNANAKAILADTAATNANTVATNVANAEAARVLAGSEVKTNKTSDIESNKTSVDKYPSVKGVYDWAVALIAAISKIAHSTENNSKIEATSTGASVKRNVADANSAVIVELVNPSSLANIAEYKFATALVASIDKNGIFSGGTEQTTTNKNKYYPLCKDISGNIIAKRFTQIWNGSAYVSDYSSGFGANSLYNNTGASSSGFGYLSLYNNTGANSNGFGYLSLQNNTGAYSNGFGANSLYNNTGAYSSGFGYLSLRDNTGAYSNGFGYLSLRYNQKNNNTAIGHNSYSNFIDNTAGNKTCASAYIDTTNERATLTNHGFGATNSYVNIKYSATDGISIGGLSVGGIYQVKVIDENTVEFYAGVSKINISSQGSGNHTFTPQFSYGNTTCLGAETQPNRDNQVVLGNSSVDTVKMGGASRTIASATAPGVKGETCWDANYFYVCIATNTWKRTALTTW